MIFDIMGNTKLGRTIAESGGFKHWFVNVFWFHYRWRFLVIVLVVAVVVFITVDAVRKPRYDATVVIATDYYVDEEEVTALDEVLKPVVEDYDGNGRVNIQYIVLFVGDTELGRENQERMYLYLSMDDISLYLMSDEISAAYTNPTLEFFTDELGQYGLDYDESNPVRLSLEGNQTLSACGLEHIYVSIMDYASLYGGSDARNALEAAVAMTNALIEAG